MTKDDFIIICGDFGGVWNKDEKSKMGTMILDWLDCKPFTALFVDLFFCCFVLILQYKC